MVGRSEIFQTYWGRVFALAWRETIKDSPVSSGLRLLLAFAPLAAALISWALFPSSIPPLAPVISLIITATLIALWAIIKVASIPPRLAADAKTLLEAATQNAMPADTGKYPDWPVKDLFFHIRPDILEHETGEERANWEKVEKQFLDAASVGRLQVWGRSFDEKGMAGLVSGDNSGPLQPVPAIYWRDVTLAHNFYSEREPTKATHTFPRMHAKGPVPLLCDLQVNRAQAETVWPGPDPNAKIQFECDLSIMGIEKVYRQSLIGIGKVVVDDDDKHRVEVFFHKPVEFQYIVSAEGNDQVFVRVERTGPTSAKMNISGPSTKMFPAIVRFKLGSNRFPKTNAP